MHTRSRVLRKILAGHTLRMTAGILFVVNTVLLLCAAQCFVFLRTQGFYSTGAQALRDQVTDELMVSRSHDALLYFKYHLLDISSDAQDYSDTLSGYEQSFAEENSNFFFYFWQNGHVVWNNYRAESAHSYYPKSADFFESGEDADLIGMTNLSFESHLKKTLTANDVFWRADRLFYYADLLKYALLAALIVLCAAEGLLGTLLCAAAGRREGSDTVHTRDIDHIPLYILLPFFGILIGFCVYFLGRQSQILTDLPRMLTGGELQPTLYICFLLLTALAVLAYSLLMTISVRLKTPTWWRRLLLYRAFSARSLGQRVRTILSVLVGAEFSAFLIVYIVFHELPLWVCLLADGAFTASMALLLHIVFKDMSVYIPATHRIAREGGGIIPTDALSDSGRRHAENINFLARAATAQTEKRYINESFSTRLIHNVSYGLRAPLHTVADDVRVLEQGGLPADEERTRVQEICALSQELKKTIEDLIHISKATTGNLPLDPAPIDAGTMLAQAVGEFYEQFAACQVEPVVEQPAAAVTLLADGQYMWTVFEGILSVMAAPAVPGTRLFLSASEAGERALLRFECTVRPDTQKALSGLGGMGLSSAKAFTLLQGGTMHDRLAHDVLRVTLLFPKG